MSYFPTLYALLHSAVASVHAILNLVVFVGIVLFCFAVTGAPMPCGTARAAAAAGWAPCGRGADVRACAQVATYSGT
jgi:hypothetical protein